MTESIRKKKKEIDRIKSISRADRLINPGKARNVTKTTKIKTPNESTAPQVLKELEELTGFKPPQAKEKLPEGTE